MFWGQMAVSFCGMGIQSALPQLVGARAIAPELALRVAGGFVVGLALFGTVVAAALTPLVPRGMVSVGWYAIALAFVPATLGALVAQGLAMARERVVPMVLLRVGSRLVYTVAVAVLLAVGEQRTAVAAAAVAGHAILQVALLSAVAAPQRPRGALAAIRLTLRRGLSNHVPSLLLIGMSLVDQGWVFTHLADEDAGLYAIALGAAMTLDVIAAAETTASTVAMSDPKTGWRRAWTALGRTAVLAGAGALLAWALAPTLIPLVYGRAFTSAMPLFRLLVAGEALYNVGRVAEAVLQSRGAPRVAWAFQGVRGVALVISMVWFGAERGAVGVALAAGVANAVGALATLGAVLWVFRRTRSFA